MIFLGRVCKDIIEKNFGKNKECAAILNDVLTIDTPVNIVCNRVNFGKSGNSYVRAVCECKVRKSNTKIIIIRENDGKLYLRHTDGDTFEIINGHLDSIDVYRYFEVEKDIIQQDMRNLLSNKLD